ncbi:ESPR-type extended signal peptide-containing protein [Stenotrophomonas sp.]|uniref:ESPR-type extended signal peptide-containing protein n=1 Tax=Stenotrophomonas sp. TaxID=69392 RepID=UPI0028A83DAF|nr:ESPR-type extended signal peptide-containing protein [Stenotrophomonas sp.]
MNKIYRRLWSTARQCWVVASELTSPRGKANQTVGKGLLAISLMTGSAAALAEEKVEHDAARFEDSHLLWAMHAAFGARSMPVSPAGSSLVGTLNTVHQQVALTTDNAYRNSTVSGNHLVILGSRSSLSGNQSVAYGNLITSRGDNNTAIGHGVQLTGGGYATGVGAAAVANGIGATALGNDARANTQNSIAVGSGSRTDSGAGISKIAIGGNAYAGTGGWTGAIALGGAARAEYDSVAIGYEAKTSATMSVALGRESIATESNTVSVGSAGKERRIVNVKDGAINGSSTDAVNGRQLSSARDLAQRGVNDAATAQRVATGAKSTADQALANSILVTQTSAASGIRIGGENTGNVLTVSNKNGDLRYLNGVRNGTLSTTSTDAVTGQQLFATNNNVTTAQNTANNALGKANALGGLVSQAAANGNVRLGGENTGAVLDVRNKSNANRTMSGLKDGAVNGTSTEAVTGKQLNTTNTEVAAARTVATSAQTTASTAKTTADSALGKANTLGGLVSQAAADGNVRLGGENTGAVLDVRNKANANRTLSGLKDGAVNATSTEAVTGKQLNTTNNEVASVRTVATAAQTAANTAKSTADNALGKANTLGGLVSQIAADGNVRLGAANTGTELDVRNKSNANRTLSGLKDGAVNATSTEAVTGKQLNTINTEVASVRTVATAAQTTASAAKSTADNALGKANTLGGLVSQVAADGNVRLGGENTGAVLDVRNKSNASRTLTGLKEGAVNASSTEAVTGKQLFATNEKVQANEGVLAGHSSDLAAQSGRITDNRRDLDALRSEFEDFDPDLDGVVKFGADGSVDIVGGKLRGVAAGDISTATSTDAVNGGQLFATNERIASMEYGGRFFKIGTDEYSEDAYAGWFGVAIGESAEASRFGEGGVAVGAYARALGTNSVALGRGSTVLQGATKGFALGAGSRVEAEGGAAFGADSKVMGAARGSIAIGEGSIADEAGTVSVGGEGLVRRITNVGRGVGLSDASTVAQLDDALRNLGAGAGMDGSGNIIAPTYNVHGGTQNNVGDALAALDSAMVTADSRVDNLEGKLRSAFQDGPSVRADGLNQLVLAGANGSVLTNLADGRIAAGSRDAVNGSQLFAAKQEIARNRSDLDDMKRRESNSGLGAIHSESSVLGDVDFGGARLTGVSDGRVSSTSSDVVTGAQLFGTNERVSNLETSGRVVAVSSANEWNSQAKIGKDSVAVGEYAAASVGSEGGTAVGHYARADSRNSVAIGQSSSVSSRNEGGVAIGSRARADGPRSAAIGDGAWVFAGADNSVAVGAGSESMRSNEFSIGSYSLIGGD